jgi:hypothetical protein
VSIILTDKHPSPLSVGTDYTMNITHTLMAHTRKGLAAGSGKRQLSDKIMTLQFKVLLLAQ